MDNVKDDDYYIGKIIDKPDNQRLRIFSTISGASP